MKILRAPPVHRGRTAEARLRPRIPRACGWLLAAAVALALPTAALAAEPGDAEFFESRVRPLLAEHCAECHSARAGDPEGGLSFDSRSDFLSAAGVAVAGRPDESLLVQVVRYDGDLQMPPAGRLPAEAVQTIEDWVRRGMPWPDDSAPAETKAAAFDIAERRAAHWCWQRPVATPPPAVRQPGWCRGDVDRHVLARLEAADLEPAPEADRAVLVRRVAEVLTGLPPDPRDVERVVDDSDPLAFDRYVDTLLASPHYGERFARHWLDVVRYAESRGHEFDYQIPNAFQYRDWVIRALNADLPYDQFVREQIAGDLLARPRLDRRTGANESVVGTGFWLLGEEVHSPVDIKQDEADHIDNRIDTFGKAFLGLTLGCARCHDHKFDAISARDYYAIAGMLMSSSYRQVPFETLEVNRGVATELAALDEAGRRRLLPQVADLVAAVDPAKIAGSITVPAAAGPPGSETVLADYTRGSGSTPIIADANAWCRAAVTAGEPRLVPLPDGRGRGLRLETVGHVRSDPVWSRMKSKGEREPGKLTEVDRAGRVLRTPKVRTTVGVLWHRVRGKFYVLAVVDSHTMIAGPLFGHNVKQIDTKGEWQWVQQDLRRDVDWSTGHVVHVEYAALAGEACVAETVAALHQPSRPADPLAAALAASKDPVATAERLRDEAVAACRSGSWPEPRRAELLAACVNRACDVGIDWLTADAGRVVVDALGIEGARDRVRLAAALASATAPAMLDGNGIDQHVLLKGSASRPGDPARRRFLEAIDGADQPDWPADSSGRLELAERVLAPANPLTSRVIVNRVWHHLFGRGLVPTTDNFGKLGEPPDDPLAQQLLDGLALRFEAEGWSLKKLVRELATSSTFRMSGQRDPRAVARDPANRLLHHYPLRRLEAEAIRDKILSVSGRLDRRVGGPGVSIYLTAFHDGRGRPAEGPLDGAGRRSIYLQVRRNFLPGFLLAFDMPVPFQAMGRRNVTNVPAQALTMMNDPFVSQQATIWARKEIADSDATPEKRIERMYRAAFARPPRTDESAIAVEFLRAQAARHGISFETEPRHEQTWADLAHALFASKEFIFVP